MAYVYWHISLYNPTQHSTIFKVTKQNLWTLKQIHQAYIFKQIFANSSYYILLIITLQCMQGPFRIYLCFLLQNIDADMLWKFLFHSNGK